MSVNDSLVMNKCAASQSLENVSVISDSSAEFARKMDMPGDQGNLNFGKHSWRYAAIINDGSVEIWFEETMAV